MVTTAAARHAVAGACACATTVKARGIGTGCVEPPEPHAFSSSLTPHSTWSTAHKIDMVGKSFETSEMC